MLAGALIGLIDTTAEGGAAAALQWLPIQEFLSSSEAEHPLLQRLGSSCLVAAIQLPLPAAASERVWAHKVSHHR